MNEYSYLDELNAYQNANPYLPLPNAYPQYGQITPPSFQGSAGLLSDPVWAFDYAYQDQLTQDLLGQGFTQAADGRWIPPVGYQGTQADFEQGIRNAMARIDSYMRPAVEAYNYNVLLPQEQAAVQDAQEQMMVWQDPAQWNAIYQWEQANEVARRQAEYDAWRATDPQNIAPQTAVRMEDGSIQMVPTGQEDRSLIDVFSDAGDPVVDFLRDVPVNPLDPRGRTLGDVYQDIDTAIDYWNRIVQRQANLASGTPIWAPGIGSTQGSASGGLAEISALMAPREPWELALEATPIGFAGDIQDILSGVRRIAPELGLDLAPNVIRVAAREGSVAPVLEDSLAAATGAVRISDPSGIRILQPGEPLQPGEVELFHGTAGPLRGGAFEEGAWLTPNQTQAQSYANIAQRMARAGITPGPEAIQMGRFMPDPEPLDPAVARMLGIEDPTPSVPGFESIDEYLAIARQYADEQSRLGNPMPTQQLGHAVARSHDGWTLYRWDPDEELLVPVKNYDRLDEAVLENPLDIPAHEQYFRHFESDTQGPYEKWISGADEATIRSEFERAQREIDKAEEVIEEHRAYIAREEEFLKTADNYLDRAAAEDAIKDGRHQLQSWEEELVDAQTRMARILDARRRLGPEAVSVPLIAQSAARELAQSNERTLFPSADAVIRKTMDGDIYYQSGGNRIYLPTDEGELARALDDMGLTHAAVGSYHGPDTFWLPRAGIQETADDFPATSLVDFTGGRYSDYINDVSKRKYVQVIDGALQDVYGRVNEVLASILPKVDEAIYAGFGYKDPWRAVREYVWLNGGGSQVQGVWKGINLPVGSNNWGAQGVPRAIYLSPNDVMDEIVINHIPGAPKLGKFPDVEWNRNLLADDFAVTLIHETVHNAFLHSNEQEGMFRKTLVDLFDRLGVPMSSGAKPGRPGIFAGQGIPMVDQDAKRVPLVMQRVRDAVNSLSPKEIQEFWEDYSKQGEVFNERIKRVAEARRAAAGLSPDEVARRSAAERGRRISEGVSRRIGDGGPAGRPDVGGSPVGAQQAAGPESVGSPRAAGGGGAGAPPPPAPPAAAGAPGPGGPKLPTVADVEKQFQKRAHGPTHRPTHKAIYRPEPFVESTDHLLKDPDLLSKFQDVLQHVPYLRAVGQFISPDAAARARKAAGDIIPHAIVRMDLYNTIQKAKARAELYNWIGRNRESFGLRLRDRHNPVDIARGLLFDNNDGIARNIPIKPGHEKNIPVKARQRLDDIAEHPEDYILTEQQADELEKLIHTQSAVLDEQHIAGVPVEEVDGLYWSRVITKFPDGDRPNGFSGIKGFVGGRKAHQKRRAFDDVRTAIGAGYEAASPIVALQSRMDSGIESIADYMLMKEIESLGTNLDLPKLRGTRTSARNSFNKARAALEASPADPALQGAFDAAKTMLERANEAVVQAQKLLKDAPKGSARYGDRLYEAEVMQEIKKYVDVIPSGVDSEKLTGDAMNEFFQFYRASKITGDFSQFLVQGNNMFWHNHIGWWKAVGNSLWSTIQDPFDYVVKNIDDVREALDYGAALPPTEYLLRSANELGIGRLSRMIGKLPVAKQTQNAFEWFSFVGQVEQWKAIKRAETHRVNQRIPGFMRDAGAQRALTEDELRQIGSSVRKEMGIVLRPGLTKRQRRLQNFVLFAPSFRSSFIGLMADLPKKGPAGTEARRLMSQLLAGSVATGMGANYALNGEVMNITDPTKKSWLGVRVDDGYVYPLGPWMTWFKTFALAQDAARRGDMADLAKHASFFARSGSGIEAGILADFLFQEDVLGRPVKFRGGSVKNIAEDLLEYFTKADRLPVPIGWTQMLEDSIDLNPILKGELPEWTGKGIDRFPARLGEGIGTRTNALTASQIRDDRWNKVVDDALGRNLVPPQLADTLRNLTYGDMTGRERKLFEPSIQSKMPKGVMDEIEAEARSRNSIFQQARDYQEQYWKDNSKTLDIMWDQLHTSKQQDRRAVWARIDAMYGEASALYSTPQYQEQVKELEQKDIYKLLDLWFEGIPARNTVGAITNWDQVEADRIATMEKLQSVDPALAARLQFNSAWREPDTDSHSMRQLFDTARPLMSDYYSLGEDADAKIEWRRNNPQGEYLLWLSGGITKFYNEQAEQWAYERAPLAVEAD